LKKSFLAYFVFVIAISAISQTNSNIEKLFDQDYRKAITDSAKFQILLEYAQQYSYDNFRKSYDLANKALDVANKTNNTVNKIRAYTIIADAYYYSNHYKKANEYYFLTYKLSDSIKDERRKAYALYNFGWFNCIQQHNFSQISYLYNSFSTYKNLNDTFGIMKSGNAIGCTYTDIYAKGKLSKNFDSSLKYLNNSYYLATIIKSTFNMAVMSNNLSELYSMAGNTKLAMQFVNISINLYSKVGDSIAIVRCLNGKAKCLLMEKKEEEAFKLSEFIYRYCNYHQLTEVKKDVLKSMALYYKKKKQFEKSLKLYEEYNVLKDTLNSQIYSTELQLLQNDYDLDKKNASIVELRQENELQELKNNRNKLYIALLFFVALVVVTIAVILLRQNRQKNKANTLLKHQNQIISDKKREIDDSIEYSKGIQHSFLPDVEILNNYFNESFIYYKPKDVVSGDFYWFSPINKHEVIIVVADCTGHGVPGALMSIVGISALNKLVNERKIYEPALILKELNNEIKDALKQNNTLTKQRDGMDIALINVNRTTQEIYFAGANRSLLIINDSNLKEYKPEKISIGGFTEYNTEFKNKVIPYKSGDTIYLCTDGFADQFGGEKGKKFMTKNLKELFVKVDQLIIDNRLKFIDDTFITWKGNFDQVDDVCILSITC
jgi:serine phosphatase RsbU (regulator of sigma subunit)